MGHFGESVAAGLLISSQNYIILEKNFKSPYGEVDIVGADLRMDSLVFFEVKTWMVYSPYELERVISSTKKKKIAQTAEFYLLSHAVEKYTDIRFDVVYIQPNPFRFLHMEGAFVDGSSSTKY